MFETSPDPWPTDDPADLRPRYRLCRLAFGLGALALALQSADIALTIGSRFLEAPELSHLVGHPNWRLSVGTPITWGAFLSALLLVGRWRDLSWNRRAGLLLLLNALDVGFWASDNARLLGLALPPRRDNWLLHVCLAMQWVELMLFASLASEVSAHLGRPDAAEASRPARTMGLIGLGLWFVTLLACTVLVPGRWPVFQVRVLEVFLLLLASWALMAVMAFQVTVLCAHASRECGRLLSELARDPQEAHLPRPSAGPFEEPPSKRRDPWA